MDYKEKYEQALERAKEELNACGSQDCDAARQIFRVFPELAESKDEKIRKAIVSVLEQNIRAGFDHSDGFKFTEMIAWLEKQKYTQRDVDDAYLKGVTDAKNELEKQGEQKPAVTDFNAKDWYVSKVDGKIHDMTYNPADKVEPIFSIGDVLCDKSCTTLNKNSQPNIEILDIRDGMYICNNCSFPISQQDEYELVAKKIEDGIEIPFGAKDSELIEERYYISEGCYVEVRDGYVTIKKDEKPTWSEEDQCKVNWLLHLITSNSDIDDSNTTECERWLKSLKDRIV